MTLQEIIAGGGLGLIIVLSLIQIAPIKINPWSAIARALGRAFNGEVLKEIEDLKENQHQTQKSLEDHIRIDDERNVDMHRARILAFNNELIRNIPHTREDFIEVLAEIDFYETYCRDHKEYKNNRCVHAIANIGRVYDERMKKHDFVDDFASSP